MKAVSNFLLILHVSLLPTTEGSNNRTQRVLGVFHVVNFPNDACSATVGSPADENDKGTCLATTECVGRGGVVSGPCASGFGACCVLYTSTCGGTIPHNTTYIRNPEYPSSYNAESSCTWTIPKIQSDVCHIRLDFDAFTLANPSIEGRCSGTDYIQGFNAKIDTNRVVYDSDTSTSGNTANLICGENTGLHMYVEAGPGSSTEPMIRIVTVGTTSARKWKIKVSQILCSDLMNPPVGCLQYYTGSTGRVRSFNFNGYSTAGTYLHLSDQYYKVCIRREEGYCKIGWVPSSDADSFKLSRPADNYKADTTFGNGCDKDWIRIEGGSNYGNKRCATSSSTAPSVDRYCGGTLNCNFDSVSPSMVVTSFLPFELEVSFNPTEKAGTNNRGFCLDFAQIFC